MSEQPTRRRRQSFEDRVRADLAATRPTPALRTKPARKADGER